MYGSNSPEQLEPGSYMTRVIILEIHTEEGLGVETSILRSLGRFPIAARQCSIKRLLELGEKAKV